jgi:hypothetical protein
MEKQDAAKDRLEGFGKMVGDEIFENLDGGHP